MPGARRYDDPCGIARALDVIGERWALLVARELMFGPKRFVQLRDGLHAVSPNVLSQRLHDLEDAGVVCHGVLDPPASVPVYQLTERGRALEPVLLELGRWGSRQPLSSPRELSASALLLALKTVFDPAAATDGTIALRLRGEWFTVTVAGRDISIGPGRAREPDATLETDVPTLRTVAFGREPLGKAEREGRVQITGDRVMAEHFTQMFPAPTGTP